MSEGSALTVPVYRPSAGAAAQLLRAGLLAFIASAFLLPTEAAYALVFYVLLAAVAWQPRVLLPSPARRRDAGVILVGLLILWSALTLLWGRDDGHRSLRFALGALCTLVFLAMMLASWERRPAAWRHLGTVLIWVASANAALSIALYPFERWQGDRLHGWGVTTHPILGASTMTVAYLAALTRTLGEGRLRAAHFGAAAIMAAFLLLTESRGPLGAALVATLFLCVAGPWRWRALGGLALLAMAWRLMPAGLQRHQAAMLVARGSSHRFEIWHRTLQMVAAHPLFGNGLAANIDLKGMTFPHDLYLSVLFYSGATGLLLFLALAALVTLRLWRARVSGGLDWLWMVALWINALISGLTDLGQITKGPGPMWFIVWLPVALVLASTAPAGLERSEG